MKKLLIILVLALLTVNINCGGGSGGSGSSSGTSLVTITIGSSSIEKTAYSSSNKVMSDMAAAAIPSNVYKIVFTISSPDHGTMVKEVIVAGQESITETFSLPNGKNWYFLVEAKDVSGNVVSSGVTTTDLNGGEVTLFIYMTALDETPPTVISTSPVNGATEVPITSVITITFSETIDSSTFDSTTFTLRNGESDVAGTITFDGALVTFTPSANLAYSTTYTATITTGVMDLAGNPMSADYSWTFTTGEAPDTTPPTVMAVSPGNSATGVAVTTTVTATFSEAMDASSINTTTFLLDSVGNTPVSGAVTYSGTTATFTPSANLAYSTTYTATITTGVMDLAGNPMSADYSWTFTTGEATQGSGIISGIVKDAATQNPLQDVSITVYNQGSPISNGSSDTNGTYSLSVPAGSGYQVEFSKAGYIPVIYYNVSVVSNTTAYLETVFMVATGGTGNVSGSILNALNGNGVDGLTINLRAGVNITTGIVVANTTTQNSGFYTFTGLNAGIYTAEVSGEGYNTTFFTIICIGGTTTPNQDATITPILSAGETRIVLTWGLTPSDLDSHLTGPTPDSGRFHVYFADEEYYYNDTLYVGLDLDDVTSYGPETTTIYQQIPGVYRFSVHDFTNSGSSSSTALSNSGAQVRVYRGNDLVATFNVPANQGGTLWTVFEMSGDNITPVNVMSYESDSYNIQSISSNKSFRTDASLIRKLPSKK
jgi:hypothetical protein